MSNINSAIFKEKKKIALLSIGVNFMLFIIKLIAGLISGATTLVADAIHSLSDLAAAVSVYTGIEIANKKTKEFPYGLYKVENLVATISAFAIFLAGYEIFRYTFFNGKEKQLDNLPLAIGTVVASIAITFLFSKYEEKKGKELNSPSLIADAEHVKTDMLSSIVVLIGIAANYFGLFLIEKLAVLVIVAFILHSGFEILTDSLKVLLDASVDNETLSKVEKILLSFPIVAKVKSLKGRNSGSYIFIEAEVYVDSDSLEQVHQTLDEIERKIKEEIPFVEKVIIHPEPYESAKRVIAIPLDEKNSISEKFCDCDYLMIGKIDREKGIIEDVKIYSNPVKCVAKSRGVELAEFLKMKGVTCVALLKLPPHKGVFYAMAENRIKIALIEEKKEPYDILDTALNNKLCCTNPLTFLEKEKKGASNES